MSKEKHLKEDKKKDKDKESQSEVAEKGKRKAGVRSGETGTLGIPNEAS